MPNLWTKGRVRTAVRDAGDIARQALRDRVRAVTDKVAIGTPGNVAVGIKVRVGLGHAGGSPTAAKVDLVSQVRNGGQHLPLFEGLQHYAPTCAFFAGGATGATRIRSKKTGAFRLEEACLAFHDAISRS